MDKLVIAVSKSWMKKQQEDISSFSHSTAGYTTRFFIKTGIFLFVFILFGYTRQSYYNTHAKSSYLFPHMAENRQQLHNSANISYLISFRNKALIFTF